MPGLSRRNLFYMRSFAEAWPQKIVQQPVAQLPWGHLTVLLDKLSDAHERDWYAAQAAEHGWSRNDNVVRYSLAGTTAPLAVANYTYDTLPEPIRELVPTDNELATAVDATWSELDTDTTHRREIGPTSTPTTDA